MECLKELFDLGLQIADLRFGMYNARITNYERRGTNYERRGTINYQLSTIYQQSTKRVAKAEGNILGLRNMECPEITPGAVKRADVVVKGAVAI